MMKFRNIATLGLLALMALACSGSSPTDPGDGGGVTPTANLTAQGTMLTWSSTGGAASISPILGGVAPAGSRDVAGVIRETTEFTLTVTGTGGQVVSDKATVSKNPKCGENILTAPPCTVDELHAKADRWADKYNPPGGLSGKYVYEVSYSKSGNYKLDQRCAPAGGVVNYYNIGAFYEEFTELAPKASTYRTFDRTIEKMEKKNLC